MLKDLSAFHSAHSEILPLRPLPQSVQGQANGAAMPCPPVNQKLHSSHDERAGRHS